MPFTFDDQIRALGSVDRRQLLATLLAVGPDTHVSTGALATDSPTDAERVRIRLHHVHLPLLAEMDVIERLGDGTRVRRGDRFEELRPLLDLLVAHSDQWPHAFVSDPPPA